MIARHPPRLRLLGLTAAGAAVALAAALALAPPARSQINTAPSWLPIGVAASGSTSTAWFHEPGTRQVMACQTVAKPAGGLAGVECVAARLP